MEVVTGATGSLLPKLGELLQEEYDLQLNVKKDVETLQRELTFMRAALRKVAGVPQEQQDEQVKAWASNVKELSYDMVDTIDTFKVRVEGNKTVEQDNPAIKSLKIIKRVAARRKLADEIKNMKCLTKELSDLRTRYFLDMAVTKHVQLMNGPRVPEPWWSLTSYGIPSNIIYHLWRLPRQIPSRVADLMEKTQMFGMWYRRYGVADILEKAQMFGTWYRRYGVYNLKRKSSGSSSKEWKMVWNQEANRHIIGLKEPVGVLDKDTKRLEKWVTETRTNTKPSVLYIVGPQGVGKTTLATALYRKFGDRFEHRAIVTMSEDSKDEVVFRNILDQVKRIPKHDNETQDNNNASAVPVGGTGISWFHRKTWTEGGRSSHREAMSPSMVCSPSLLQNALLDDLKEHVSGHSCLIVVDNVWSSKKTLEGIRSSLPIDKGCRIIVTTRFPAVAASMAKEQGDVIHELTFLDNIKSKELFMDALSESRIGSKNGEPKWIRNIPAGLLEMCGGQPLAIIMMAGYVSSNPDKFVDGWRQICSELAPDSFTQASVPRLLSNCYNDMPAEIKTCSLYLSMYPKGYSIKRKNLIRRWIAEGFVSEKMGQSAEDVAETYFTDLIMWKIIKPTEFSSSGNVRSCKTYETILDYIVSKAFEENFATVINSTYLFMPPASSKVRRLFLQNGDPGHENESFRIRLENETKKINLSHVRSLTISGSMLKLLFHSSNFPIMQVLDLEGCRDFKNTEDICKMLLLKYLNLRGTGVKLIHKKIEKLKNLETLDIRDTNVTKLPETICQLDGLLRLLGGNKRTRRGLQLPKDVNKMKALCILSGIEITTEDSQNAVENLQHLTSLRKLAIYKLQAEKADKLLHSIKSLCYNSLRTLVVHDDTLQFLQTLDDLTPSPKFSGLQLYGMLVKLPRWITGLVALTKLTLPITALREDALKNLSHLGGLFSLSFSFIAANKDLEFPSENHDAQTAAILEANKAYSDGEIIVPSGGFQNLKLLRFSASMVPVLNFVQNTMPKLERIELCFSILEGIYGIENLNMLEEVHIRVHKEADNFTNSVVEDIRAAVSGRVIVDRY
ncbi:unnamed protein product [Urochloa decumbens]|uniref:AAA+ ATPase domain-containing protein n=1 Tax=Urochloa decumbens TaxID=240449 RepID=A0ABC9ARJ6_9POAL